jgi:hypothetical protein
LSELILAADGTGNAADSKATAGVRLPAGPRIMSSSQAANGGCEPGYHVFAASLEAEFAHNLLE